MRGKSSSNAAASAPCRMCHLSRMTPGSASSPCETVIEVQAAASQPDASAPSVWDALLSRGTGTWHYHRLVVAPARHGLCSQKNWLAARRQQGIAQATICAADDLMVMKALQVAEADPAFVTRLLVLVPGVDGLLNHIAWRYSADALMPGGEKGVRFFNLRPAIKRGCPRVCPLYVIEEHMLEEHFALLQRQLDYFLRRAVPCCDGEPLPQQHAACGVVRRTQQAQTLSRAARTATSGVATVARARARD